MKKCNECSVSIVSGSFCSLCAKAMKSTKEASMKSIKSKLVINDLSLDSAKLYFKNSIAASYGEDVLDEEVIGMFSDTELEFSELEMLGKHTTEFLANAEKDNMSLDDAKAILEVSKYNFDGMSDELVIEIAKQFKDVAATGKSRTYRKDDRIKVTVQRESTEGFWYTAKRVESNGDKNPINYFFEVEDLFEVDDNGNVIDLKMIGSEPALTVIMFNMGYREIYMQYVGEGRSLPLRQRFLIQAEVLFNVERLNGVDLNQVCAPFFFVHRKGQDPKEVCDEGYTGFAYDNITDLGNCIAVLPSDNAESIEDTLNRKYNEGILTGTAVANNFMVMADIQKDEIEENYREEAALKREAKKAQIVATKINASRNARMATALYKKTVELIKLSEANAPVIFEPATLDSDLGISGLPAAEKYEAKLTYFKEMLENARVYRNVSSRNARQGSGTKSNGFSPRDFKALNEIINKYTNYSKIEAVIDAPANILTHINALNDGSRTLTDFTIEQLTEIYKTAAKYRSKHVEFNIKPAVATKILGELRANGIVTKVA